MKGLPSSLFPAKTPFFVNLLKNFSHKAPFVGNLTRAVPLPRRYFCIIFFCSLHKENFQFCTIRIIAAPVHPAGSMTGNRMVCAPPPAGRRPCSIKPAMQIRCPGFQAGNAARSFTPPGHTLSRDIALQGPVLCAPPEAGCTIYMLRAERKQSVNTFPDALTSAAGGYMMRPEMFF